jgi:thiol-disulfide isomerase/thioredoxin
MNGKKKLVILASCLALLCLWGVAALAADVEPKVGLQAGNVKFSPTLSAEDQKYLGLEKPGAFTLQDIKAPYVLVESFNTTCPHCQHQAPVMNGLYNLVNQDAKLKDKLKFLAAGQGNDEGAVKMWKVFYKIPFPVVPDKDTKLGNALNFHPYPVTVILDKKGTVVFAHIGAFDNAEEVLKGIKAVVK